MELPKLLDFEDYPEIKSDGVGEVQIIGHDARLLLFHWRKIDGLWQPVVNLMISRPIETLASDIKIEEALSTPPHDAGRIGMH